MNEDSLLRVQILESIDKNTFLRTKSLIKDAIQEDKKNITEIFALGLKFAKSNELNIALLIFNQLNNNAIGDVKIPFNIGLIHSLQGNHLQAIDAYKVALQIKKNDIDTLINIGSSYIDTQNYSSALEVSNIAISLNFNIAAAWINKGVALSNLNFYEEAIVAYDQAVNINQNSIEALSNKSVLLTRLKKFSDACDLNNKILEQAPNYARGWFNKGETLFGMNLMVDAINCYDRAITLNPNYAEAYLNKGIALHEIKQFDEAIKQYDVAINIDVNYAEAYFNKGITLHRQGHTSDAITLTGHALAINPNLTEAWASRGRLFLKIQDYENAITHFSKALTLYADLQGVQGDLLHSNMIVCNWSQFNSAAQEVILKVNSENNVINPFALSALTDDGALCRRCAEISIGKSSALQSLIPPITKYPKKKRITVGYFSANFHNHAIGFLMAELFELHDKNKFEIIGFSFGPSQRDETRKRIFKEFDQFFEVGNTPDSEIVKLSRDMKIDIAIDLIGFTENLRNQVFSHRVAPIQVNYLGYPGTMGADFYDYLIADKMIIPDKFSYHYSEKIAYLPDSYQINDSKKKISQKKFERHELGLPDKGFIFTCFNNNYKILPDVFNVWMRILLKVEDSVLWLLADNRLAKDNLCKEASFRGVDPKRLIFAERTNLSEHLSRHKQADLFLDTFPYNAHTTASDALWTGTPIISLQGNSFASRVSSSLLSAIGLPELITTSLEEYEELAIKLATNPEILRAIKLKLESNRLTHPLFDSKLFTKNLEALYIKMYERYQDNLKPDSISLACLE